MRILLPLLVLVATQATAQNLLKNGSFEGGTRYWFDLDNKSIVTNDAAQGQSSLRIERGSIQSAAFELTPAKPVTISFSAKATAPTTIGWQCSPCSREIGVKAGQTWGMKAHHPVKISTDWQRYSFTFTPTAAQDGFWPRPTYMLQFGDGDKPWQIDAITVAYNDGEKAYIPHNPLEAQLNCPDLKGYTDETGNLLPKGQTITLVGAASNPGATERTVTLRWQLIDYEGQSPLADPIEKQITLPANKTITEQVQLKLNTSGMTLGRFSILENNKLIDSSDIPLCSLAYPFQNTRPNFAEKFGGSLFGPHNTDLVAKTGMAWSRWRPHMNWEDHQKTSPDTFTWLDATLDELESKGFSTHCVLYGKPKWAFAKESDQLPKDMNWPANDPRWNDLTPQCAWDNFIIQTVKHYKPRSLVYEIENEPEFDGWENKKDLYAAFTLRTARLIKQTDPNAKVMVNNVYAIPSGINRHLLEKGAGKFIDIISWHDYHDGWLTDATSIKRMRSALDDLDCKHIQIWFNEGWAYTNTIVDEPAVALTHLNSAQSANTLVASVAEMTIAGQEKTILFHTGYEDHGMSFWDYAGPGTMLWDWYGYPLPLVPAWNTLAYHIGLSDRVALIRPPVANLCVFEDLRNKKGVIIAYADREAKQDVTLDLPLKNTIIAEDIMGNPAPLKDNKLTLSKTGRPVYLYTAEKTPGKQLADQLLPLDRKNAAFVSAGGTSFKLPPTWEGAKKDSTEGNPVLANNQPIWQLDQVFPPDPAKSENFHPLAWRDGWWVALKDGAGGQPKAELKDASIRMEFRAPNNQSPGEKICALTFTAPQAATYSLTGAATLKLWDGNNKTRLTILHRTKDTVNPIATLPLKRDAAVNLSDISAKLAKGDQIILLPRIEGMFTGGDITLRDLTIATAQSQTPTYRLPAAWEGTAKGTPQNNPIANEGQPLWRLDQVWPPDPTIANNYTPLHWTGTAWFPEKNSAGGQPEVKVEDGAFQAAVRGSWTGNEGQRIAALVFIAPKSGIYTLTATASSKPWEGQAKTYKLELYKKDTQRATLENSWDLPRDNTSVTLNHKIELTAGHELILLPTMPDWHNATTTTIKEIQINLAKE